MLSFLHNILKVISILLNQFIMENGKAVNNLSAYYEKKSTPTVKSYRNAEFLNSSEARTIRIQCELEESKWRLKKEGVKATVLVFGSARAKSRTQFDNSIRDLNVSNALILWTEYFSGILFFLIWFSLDCTFHRPRRMLFPRTIPRELSLMVNWSVCVLVSGCANTSIRYSICPPS